jgi:hypothetical protein
MKEDQLGRVKGRVIELASRQGHPPLRLLVNADENDPGSTCADCGSEHSESLSDIYHSPTCPSAWRNIK